MPFIETLTAPLQKALGVSCGHRDDLVIAVDLTLKGTFGEEWLVVTMDRLLVYASDGDRPLPRLDAGEVVDVPERFEDRAVQQRLHVNDFAGPVIEGDAQHVRPTHLGLDNVQDYGFALVSFQWRNTDQRLPYPGAIAAFRVS